MPEKDKILKMVAEGKITVEEAEKLLNVIKGKKSQVKTGSSLIELADKIKGSNPFSGKIIIDIKSAKGESVKIKLPLKLANLALGMVPKDKLSELNHEGINLRDIINNISNVVDEIDDDIVNITSASGDVVRVFIER